MLTAQLMHDSSTQIVSLGVHFLPDRNHNVVRLALPSTLLLARFLDSQAQTAAGSPNCRNLTNFAYSTLVLRVIFRAIEWTARARFTSIDGRKRSATDLEFCVGIVLNFDCVCGGPFGDGFEFARL